MLLNRDMAETRRFVRTFLDFLNKEVARRCVAVGED
jgi:hypothetical protein